MGVDLKHQEDTLRLLTKKVDAEIVRFQKLVIGIEAKRAKVEEAVHSAGLQPVPVDVQPHSDDSANLEQEVKRHLLELNKLKNFINGKLNVVLKEEELLSELKKKYGENIGLKKLPGGEFELTFSDSETEKAFSELKRSKGLLATVRGTVQSIVETEEGE